MQATHVCKKVKVTDNMTEMSYYVIITTEGNMIVCSAQPSEKFYWHGDPIALKNAWKRRNVRAIVDYIERGSAGPIGDVSGTSVAFLLTMAQFGTKMATEEIDVENCRREYNQMVHGEKNGP